MNGAHNHNVEQKKLDTKEYSLHGSIHRKLEIGNTHLWCQKTE